jgi:hypothetical protein
MAEGLLSKATDRLKSALGGLFEDPAPSTPRFPESPPQPHPEPTITVRKRRLGNPTPNPEPKEPFGKITSYNWQGDPYTDSNSRNWIGSFGKISPIGMAISPDIEKQFREAGIKPKDKVKIVLSDGTEMERIWDNRTMQDKQAIRKFGKPLTGRFDLHFPEGKSPHEKDGIAVVGFQKLASAE